MTLKPVLALILTTCFLAVEVVATPIPIANGNFEAASPQFLTRSVALDSSTPAGWQTTGHAVTGFYAYKSGSLGATPSPTVFATNVNNSSGRQYIFPNEEFLVYTSDIGAVRQGSLFQETEAISQYTDYSLTAQVLNRWDEPGFPQGASFSFFAGSLANIIMDFDIMNPGEGLSSFQQFTVSAAQLAPYQGQTLGIAFSTPGNSFLHIDNVSLEAIDVPAPATLALFLMGGFALLWKRARRAKR